MCLTLRAPPQVQTGCPCSCSGKEHVNSVYPVCNLVAQKYLRRTRLPSIATYALLNGRQFALPCVSRLLPRSNNGNDMKILVTTGNMLRQRKVYSTIAHGKLIGRNSILETAVVHYHSRRKSSVCISSLAFDRCSLCL